MFDFLKRKKPVEIKLADLVPHIQAAQGLTSAEKNISFYVYVTKTGKMWRHPIGQVAPPKDTVLTISIEPNYFDENELTEETKAG